MVVYVLYHYWDTPDNEGSEIIGVYENISDASAEMNADVMETRAQYDPDFWCDDMTWDGDREIHLGYDPMNGTLATIYCWMIVEKEVR